MSLWCPYGVPTLSLWCPNGVPMLKKQNFIRPKPYVHRMMPYALRPSPYTLHTTPLPYALLLRPTSCDLHPTPYALCTTTYILRSTHYVLSHQPYAIHPTPNAQAQFTKSNVIHMSSHIYCSIQHTHNTSLILHSTLDLCNRDTYATTKSRRRKSNSVVFMECTCYNIYVFLKIVYGESKP
jgi:hypothetical protein